MSQFELLVNEISQLLVWMSVLGLKSKFMTLKEVSDCLLSPSHLTSSIETCRSGFGICRMFGLGFGGRTLLSICRILFFEQHHVGRLTVATIIDPT